MEQGDKYIHFNKLPNTGLFIRGDKAFLFTDYNNPDTVRQAVTTTKSILSSLGFNTVIDSSLTSKL